MDRDFVHKFSNSDENENTIQGLAIFNYRVKIKEFFGISMYYMTYLLFSFLIL